VVGFFHFVGFSDFSRLDSSLANRIDLQNQENSQKDQQKNQVEPFPEISRAGIEGIQHKREPENDIQSDPFPELSVVYLTKAQRNEAEKSSHQGFSFFGF
jgi:hypothetical protein